MSKRSTCAGLRASRELGPLAAPPCLIPRPFGPGQHLRQRSWKILRKKSGCPVEFMYNRSFQDLGGHLWEIVWVDPAAV